MNASIFFMPDLLALQDCKAGTSGARPDPGSATGLVAGSAPLGLRFARRPPEIRKRRF
jgi:hypothetical protein